MGQTLEEYKKENIDKIKIGLCLEVIYINDFIDNQLGRIKRIIDENSGFSSNSSILFFCIKPSYFLQLHIKSNRH